MFVTIAEDRKELGRQAAKLGAEHIRKTLEEKECCNVAFVSGQSQIRTLECLSKAEGINWKKVNIFLLDEFIGLEKGHAASSAQFIKDNFLKYIGEVASFHEINSDPETVEKTVEELNKTMENHPLDVAFICIGENGHLAFNDPPADFDTKDPYIVVEREKRSRRQQANEGWFKSVNEVPETAITMSIYEILSAKHIVISCPDQRKAKAVAMGLFDYINPLSPCSAIRRASDVSLFLDRQSSCLVYGDRRS